MPGSESQMAVSETMSRIGISEISSTGSRSSPDHIDQNGSAVTAGLPDDSWTALTEAREQSISSSVDQ
jgi:hypothetical protein